MCEIHEFEKLNRILNRILMMKMLNFWVSLLLNYEEKVQIYLINYINKFI